MENLIMLHGAIGNAQQLFPLKDRLKSDFDVHVLEFDGHGAKARSSAEAPFSVEGFVHELEAYIISIGTPVHLFGYSMGGFIALLTSTRVGPAIASITTLGTKLLWNAREAEKEVKQLDPIKIKEKVPAFFHALEQRHGKYWIDVLDRTSNFLKELGENNPIIKEYMSRIHCPVQLLLGDKDEMVTEEETMEVVNWISGAEFKILPDTPHPIEKVSTDFLAHIIKDFIKKGA